MLQAEACYDVSMCPLRELCVFRRAPARSVYVFTLPHKSTNQSCKLAAEPPCVALVVTSYYIHALSCSALSGRCFHIFDRLKLLGSSPRARLRRPAVLAATMGIMPNWWKLLERRAKAKVPNSSSVFHVPRCALSSHVARSFHLWWYVCFLCVCAFVGMTACCSSLIRHAISSAPNLGQLVELRCGRRLVLYL
jgi:hypothetical protein